MFRKLINQTFSSRLTNNCFFTPTRSFINAATKEQFLEAWAKMPESSRNLTAMAEERPQFAEVLLHKANIYKAKGFYNVAIETYKDAAKLDKSYEEKVKYEVQEIEDFLQRRSNLVSS